ncbi:MAG: proline racemase family protein [Acidobacteriota bacterium]
MRCYKTIDAHAAGEPLRLIVEGFPAPKGRTMLEKRAWVKAHADRIRRSLMQEPRGHLDMYGAVLTEPVSPEADSGVLFMHNDGYSTMCGHGIIAVATMAIERGLLHPRRPGQIVFDAPAGLVRATTHLAASREPASARRSDPRVGSVSFLNVPSFVLHPGLAVDVGGRTMRVDVAFGGAFYAIVDAESAGIPVLPARLADLRRVGMQIKRAVEAAVTVEHPDDRGLTGIYGTIFTGPPDRADADLKNVTVFADAQVDRSPCGTGTCAVMAVVDAMGLLAPDRPFRHESIVGTVFSGRVASRTRVGDYDAIVPELEGSAWITGEHTFLVDAHDPLGEGFRL